jgi:hypothetical protein
VTNLKFFISKNEFFSKDAINVWYIEILTMNHIHIEDDKHSYTGHSLKLIVLMTNELVALGIMIKCTIILSFDFKPSHDVIVNNYVNRIHVQNQ